MLIWQTPLQIFRTVAPNAHIHLFLLIFLKTTLKARRKQYCVCVYVYHVGLFFAYKQLVHLSLVFGKSSKRLKRDLTSTKPVSALFVGKIRKKPQEEELFYGRGAKAKLTKFFSSLLSSILLLVLLSFCNKTFKKKRLCWKWITSHKYLQAMLNSRYVSIEVVCIIVF